MKLRLIIEGLSTNGVLLLLLALWSVAFIVTGYINNWRREKRNNRETVQSTGVERKDD